MKPAGKTNTFQLIFMLSILILIDKSQNGHKR